MSLQGSFQTIALRDVMALLAASNKTGELRVVGEHVEGRLWLIDGQLVESNVGKAVSHVDALFELMRLSEGNFVFKDGVDAPEPGEAVAIEGVVHQAEERLKEWQGIIGVVPSVEHRVRLIPDLPATEVTLSAEEWHLVMAIALAGTVQGVLEELSLGQFEGCRGIRRLVDAGLVIVDPPRVRSASPRPARRSSPATATPAVDAVPVAAAGSPPPGDLGRRQVVASRFAEASELVGSVEPTVYFHPAGTSGRDDEAATEAVGGTVHHFPQAYPIDEPGGDEDDAPPFYGDGDEASSPEPFAFPSRKEPVADSLHERRIRRRAPVVRDQPAAGLEPTASPSDGSKGYGETTGEPINRGLLLKFLSSVRS